jgi:UPF0271 protein
MQALDDRSLARAVAEAVAEIDPGLVIYTLAGSELWDATLAAGVRPVAEFFADRPLRADGSVVMFRWWEVFEASPEVVAGRVRDLVTTGRVASIEGPSVEVRADTVCVHSDTPGAEHLGPAVRATLDDLGVAVRAPGKVAAGTG